MGKERNKWCIDTIDGPKQQEKINIQKGNIVMVAVVMVEEEIGSRTVELYKRVGRNSKQANKRKQSSVRHWERKNNNKKKGKGRRKLPDLDGSECVPL